MEKNGVSTDRVVIIGGSAGSLDIILKVVSTLPVHSNAAFIIVVHRKNDDGSILRDLLATRTLMMVREVEDKDPILPNQIYLAPPDYHLLIENPNAFSLDSSEKINYSRPSIDVSFQSVADVFGRGVIAVLLSGANADGAAGLEKVRLAGGVTVVQDPTTAEMEFMPREAIARGPIDKVVPAQELPELINSLLQ
ncbi:MAG: chemotaxis protein CheB [Chitinophagaceae bacterium]|nr:MAG: chemotaxis protein CheB [Chitinophagaceae bacterium]